MTDAPFFAFEADFVESLRCIPMGVRLKLDTCGVKLKLTHWHQFTHSERHTLAQLPCATDEEIQAYRTQLQALVTHYTGAPATELPIDPQPPWLAPAIPESVSAKAIEVGTQITQAQWATLTPAQRFALIKLSRPSHENRNFVPALQEFGLR